MNTRLVAFAGGLGFVNITASIPAHEMTVVEDGTPSNELEASFPQDSYVEVKSYPVGAVIKRVGGGREGIIGKPAGYVASNTPATGDTCLKVRTKGGAATNFRVEEFETPQNN